MHEIITLQLGQRANYLATHFWNTQESYFTYSSDQESPVNHDTHFRPGLGADGSETFTPRTVIYDLKGGFGSLKKINALYEVDEPGVPQGLWNGPTVVQRMPLIQQNPYQQSLEEGSEPPALTTSTVKYWSDFNHVYFHPRSIVQLNEYELGSSLMPFERWNVGDELFHDLDKEHDLLDRDLRPFAEEADHMQGIQLMTSIDDAWGGFASRYLDRIRDEYGKTTVYVWGLEDGLASSPRDQRFLKLSNTAKSISEISPQASLFIPMSIPARGLPPYIAMDIKSSWHVSALFSTALETMTLPSRLKVQGGRRHTLDELVNALNINGNQNIAKLRMSIDQTKAVNGHGPGRLDDRGQSRDGRLPSQERRVDETDHGEQESDLSDFDVDFFPTETGERLPGRRTPKEPHVFGQSESARAEEIPEAEADSEVDLGIERSRRRAAGLPIIQRTRMALPFPLLDSFPRIYGQQRDSAAASIGLRSALSTDSSVALRLKTLQRMVGRTVGMEEREALSNSLGEMAEAYEEGWDSGSDSEDD